ncbi:MAG: helix-turn-helix domain-containing protein [Candidatus Thermoplasmatota archaeon]|nr:helix-turn-helix domain-containing protein [Candidatus Thalassarchaeum sp.]MEE3310208.1 helix-turn-helix domain-containing protein [Candidatus Thermoplasmatota archaeon]
MSKIRVDGRTMALSHPTRLAMYEELLNAEEMSTVMLQKKTGVTRYHLYHHLQSLEKNGLIENHRNEGRARWWKVTERVTLTPATSTDWLHNLPADVRALLEAGAEVHFIPVPNESSSVVAAKRTIGNMAEIFDVDLDMGVTFMPNGILVLGPPKRS